MQNAIHLIQFGTSERNSFGSVRDFKAQSVIHLVQFGTSERDSFDSVRDFKAQSAIHLIQFGTSERRARFIWFSSGLQSAVRLQIVFKCLI